MTDERASGRIYNVAEPETLTHERWLRTVGRLAGWDGEIVAVPKEDLPPHLETPNDLTQDMVVDSSRLRQELGYVESTLPEEGIARAIAWERTHPPDRVNPKWLDFAAER
ncbi:MAG: hypothetical protein M3P30_00330 [Chloroflexota bacterium]|nr:hypothetical protein [Chloroflexota bacterium]